MATKTTPKKPSEILQALTEIREQLRRKPRRRDDDDEAPRDRHSMQARLAEVTRQRNEAEERLERALSAAEELRGAHDAELSEVRESAARDVAAVATRHQEHDSLRGLAKDLDDAGLRVIRAEFDALPEASRPKTVVDWFKTLKPDAAPRTIRDYLRVEDSDDADKKATEKKAAAKPPPIDRDRKKVEAKSEDDKVASMTPDEYESWMREKRLARLTGRSA